MKQNVYRVSGELYTIPGTSFIKVHT